MILSIDFGGAVVKVLAVRANGDYRITEYPLGFKTRPHWTLFEALQHIIQDASRQFRRRYGGSRGQGSPRNMLAEPPQPRQRYIYASGEIASIKFKELLSAPPLDPEVVYERSHIPVVDVGHRITYLGGRTFRGELEAAEVCRFLPRKITALEVENYLGNKELYPQLVPLGPREHAIEQAMARVKISRTAADVDAGLWRQEPAAIALTGAVFAKAPSLGEALLTFLDAVRLPPVTEVFLDTQLIIPALATLSMFQEDLAEKVLQQEPLLALGAVFSLSEEVNLELDLGLREPLALSVAANRLTCIPLAKGKTARVEFDSPRHQGSFEVRGGGLGLVIDTRPKPLQMPSSRRECWKMITAWKESLCQPALE